MLTIGSLATGYGGLDLAVERLTGAKTVWVSEVDPGACAILEYRFPGVPNLGDITRAYWARVEPVDILTAGYPCQPFSHAGRRKGTDDPRHIWPFIATAVLALRPRLVFLENVAGHLSSGFGDVLGDLAAMGFDARWGVLGSDDVGADHCRERCWIVADAVPRFEPMGRYVPGGWRQPKQVAWNAHRQAVCKPGFLGKPDGMGDRMDRNRAIGNGQDPRVAAAAWRMLDVWS